MLRLALIQMRVEPGAKRDNLKTAARLVAESAGQGAQMAILPEAMTVGWTDSLSAALADEISTIGKFLSCAAARRRSSRR